MKKQPLLLFADDTAVIVMHFRYPVAVRRLQKALDKISIYFFLKFLFLRTAHTAPELLSVMSYSSLEEDVVCVGHTVCGTFCTRWAITQIKPKQMNR